MAAINSVGAFVLFLGKLTVVVATVFIGIEIVDLSDPLDEATGRRLKYEWAPVVVGGVIAYIIADCFIAVYGVRQEKSTNIQISKMTCFFR